jgi:hypothetical protein
MGKATMLDGPGEQPDFFDGSVLRWARVAGLALGEIVYPPAKERPVHAHDRACFHYLFEGGYVEQHTGVTPGTFRAETQVRRVRRVPRPARR